MHSRKLGSTWSVNSNSMLPLSEKAGDYEKMQTRQRYKKIQKMQPIFYCSFSIFRVWYSELHVLLLRCLWPRRVPSCVAIGNIFIRIDWIEPALRARLPSYFSYGAFQQVLDSACSVLFARPCRSVGGEKKGYCYCIHSISRTRQASASYWARTGPSRTWCESAYDATWWPHQGFWKRPLYQVHSFGRLRKGCLWRGKSSHPVGSMYHRHLEANRTPSPSPAKQETYAVFVQDLAFNDGPGNLTLGVSIS